MLKRFFPICIILLFASSVWSQTKPKDDFEVNDIPEEDVHPYFALGAGFNVNILAPKFDDINAMTKPLGIPALSGGMILTGGAGFISSPFGKNLRVGGTAYGGKICESVDSLLMIGGVADSVKRTMTFTLAGGGLALEYVIPFGFTRNKLILIGGAMLGIGSITVQLNQVTSDPLTWNNFYSGPGQNYARQIHATYFAYKPYINLEYSLFAFLMLRATVGYNGTVMGTFTQDLDDPISGVPGINGNGLVYGGGIYLGIFR